MGLVSQRYKIFPFKLDELEMDDLINEAIEFIRKHEPPEGYFVGFSGGKDSIVTLDLVRRSGVKHQAYYNMTLIDPPEVVRFIKQNYPDVIPLKPDFTFWQGVIKKGFPTRLHRWCCQYLKHSTKENKKIVAHKQFIAGLRAEESQVRKSRGRIAVNPQNKVITRSPIFEWSSPEIWEYINGHELKYPSLYDEGFGRIGCIVCPMLTKRKVQQHRERWPGIYRVLEIYLDRVWHIHKVKLIESNYTYEEFMSWPNWKTKEQRKQLNLY